MKPKSIKRINQQYPAGRNAKKKKTFSDLLLEQKYFHHLKIEAYPHNSLNSSQWEAQISPSAL